MISNDNFHLLSKLIEFLDGLSLSGLSLTHVSPQGAALKGPKWLQVDQQKKDQLMSYVQKLRISSPNVNTNLRTHEELIEQYETYHLPYLHIIANGSILPWFGVSDKLSFTNIIDDDFPLRSFCYKCNTDYLDNLFKYMSSCYQYAIRLGTQYSIPMDDILYANSYSIMDNDA